MNDERNSLIGLAWTRQGISRILGKRTKSEDEGIWIWISFELIFIIIIITSLKRRFISWVCLIPNRQHITPANAEAATTPTSRHVTTFDVEDTILQTFKFRFTGVLFDILTGGQSDSEHRTKTDALCHSVEQKADDEGEQRLLAFLWHKTTG